jgi:hypothetical protein
MFLNLEACLDRLECVEKQDGNTFTALCAVCRGAGRSLSLRRGDRIPVVVRCVHGCEWFSIFGAIAEGAANDNR